jgi:HTH-type transcriptional regulator, transcriptional repressor of NAD biosynthesis genes
VKPRHGVVAARFDPPHAGQHRLVRTASRTCERVTVLVLAGTGERTPLERRVAWLREVHAHEANVSVASGDARELGPVDAVFGSAELARRLGVRHISVEDVDELTGDPVARWEELEPPVRAYLTKRLVIAGAESTGKTTLARELRDLLAARGGALAETRWVPEYGRDFTFDKLAQARAEAQWRGERTPGMDDLVWTSDDFTAIAREQNELEQREARVGGPLLVCDTDAFATAVWHERYLGARSTAVESLADPRPRLYLVTHHDDVPFAADEIRDGEHLRAWMTSAFVERLRESPHRFELVRGGRAERLQRACELATRWLAEGAR